MCFVFVACVNQVKKENTQKIPIQSSLDARNLLGDIISINEVEFYANIEMPDSIGELYNRTYYEFDNDGYQILLESYGSLDNLIERKITEVDELGYIKSENVYDGVTEEFSHSSLYEYDESGKIIKVESCDEDNELISETVYEYDENGRVSIVSSSFGNNHDEQFRSEYKYNNDGKRNYSYSQDFANQYYRKYMYDYYENGLMCNKLVLSDDEKVIQDFSYEYKYDNVGNWIKKIEIDRGRPTHITLREFSYKE